MLDGIRYEISISDSEPKQAKKNREKRIRQQT